jgi:hypothetical protein
MLRLSPQARVFESCFHHRAPWSGVHCCVESQVGCGMVLACALVVSMQGLPSGSLIATICALLS